MATSHLSAPRNAFAFAARTARSAVFKDRRAPRGGTQNWAKQWLDEGTDDNLGPDEMADLSSTGPADGPSGRFKGSKMGSELAHSPA